MLGLHVSLSHFLSLFTHLRWTDRWLKQKDGWTREVRYICNPRAQEELRCHSERLKAFIGNDDVRQKDDGHPLVSVVSCGSGYQTTQPAHSSPSTSNNLPESSALADGRARNKHLPM